MRPPTACPGLTTEPQQGFSHGPYAGTCRRDRGRQVERTWRGRKERPRDRDGSRMDERLLRGQRREVDRAAGDMTLGSTLSTWADPLVQGTPPPLTTEPPCPSSALRGEPRLLLPSPPAFQPSPGSALADKKLVLPGARYINFDTEKGIFYYPGIFLHLFRDLLAQPPPRATSLFRQ